MNDPGFDPEFAAASDWAKLYRANGVQVVPCKNKIPRLKSWKEYQNALVPDAQFDAWYGHGGEFAQSYDMGMLTGTASGRVLMIDLDVYKAGGYAAAQWWQGVLAVHNNGFEPETWKQITGGGGIQLFFLYPPEWKFAVNAKTDINVDVRCQGGFAVLPPTLHASGANYTWVDGFAPWEIPIAAAPGWLLEEVERLVREHGGGHGQNPSQNGEGFIHTPRQNGNGQFDAFGHQTDGREDKMYKQIWAALVGYRMVSPIPPGAREMEAVWEQFERGTEVKEPQPGETKLQGLERERRGPTEFHKKWLYTLKKWHTEIKRDAEERAAKEKTQPGREGFSPYTDFTEEFAKAKDQGTDAGDIFPFLDVDQIMDKPDPVWVVDGIINERALGFIFGPPSSLKTFIALDLALSMAASLPQWWGRNISRHGAVVYLCREGTSSFKLRIRAWELHRKCAARGQPFFLIEHPCNFMDGGDVGKVVATIKAVMARAGVPVAAVIVDTVSRVLPGAEENLQKDMTRFVYACELIQLEFQCIVIGVHHTNKNGSIRGSTVIPGAGDFLLETRRETGSKTGTMVLQKVKDGEDGIEVPFKFTKYEGLGTFGDKSSLVVDATDDTPKAASSKKSKVDDFPDGVTRKEIMSQLDAAWVRGAPWNRNQASGERYIIKILTVKWQLKSATAKRLLDGWEVEGYIKHEERDAKNHVLGFKKLKDL